MSKFLVRKEIALRIELGEIYDQVNAPSVRSTSVEKRVNTLFRLLNACFLPRNYKRLSKLNDNFGRQEFESVSGGNPVKEFWVEISDTVNDNDDDQITLLLFTTGNSANEHMHKLVNVDKINMNDFNTTTHKTCKENMADLMKCRQQIMRSKKTSGTHSNDTWTYLNTKHLTPRKNILMPPLPVYYLDLLCQEHPDMDQAYTDVLADHLKSDSSMDPSEITEDTSTTKGSDKVKEEFLRAIEQTNNYMKRASKDAATQRSEMLNLQKQEADQKRTAQYWTEYTSLSEKYLSLKDNFGNHKMIRNLAKRLVHLEEKIEVEESVVEEEDRPVVVVPCVVAVSAVAAVDALPVDLDADGEDSIAMPENPVIASPED